MTNLEIAKDALQQIADMERSANSGWNGLVNASSLAQRTLADIRRREELAIDRSTDADAFPNK